MLEEHHFQQTLTWVFMSYVPNARKLARLEEKAGNPVIEGKPQPQ